jgi:hypothetical protein
MVAASPFQFDLRQMAVGILYLNLGRAKLNFPTLSRSHPSEKVVVSLSAPVLVLSDSHRDLFPFSVRWDVWEKVVVPLFADGSVLVRVLEGTNDSLRLQINRELLLTGDVDALLAKIEQAVLRGLVDNSYVPSSVTTTGYVAGTDPPLTYERDTELAAAALQEQADAQDEAVWVESLDVTPQTEPVEPETQSGSALTLTAVVPLLGAPGEPVVRTGNSDLEYQQFDT